MSLNEDLAELRLFNEKVDRLEATRLAKRLLEEPPELLVTWHETFVTSSVGRTINMTGRVNAVVSGHDQDDIDAFVLTYRLFVQKNDRASLHSLATIYEREWMPAEAAKRLHEGQSNIEGYLDSYIVVSVGDERITRRYLVDIILYGGLAHNNRAKEHVYRSWMEDGAAGFFWVEFLATLTDMLKYLISVRSLNIAVLTNVSA